MRTDPQQDSLVAAVNISGDHCLGVEEVREDKNDRGAGGNGEEKEEERKKSRSRRKSRWKWRR